MNKEVKTEYQLIYYFNESNVTEQTETSGKIQFGEFYSTLEEARTAAKHLLEQSNIFGANIVQRIARNQE